jgi:Vacuolar protein sorting-associated protein 62
MIFDHSSRLQEHNSAESVIEVRTRLNEVYGKVDTQARGEETRTTLRYNPGVTENLCVFHDKGQVFKYNMGNWKLSYDHLEVEYVQSDDMDWVYEGSAKGTILNIKRPEAKNGFFRLGDVAFTAGATTGAWIVKANGEDILKEPIDYEEVWSDYSSEGQLYAGARSWSPVAPSPDYVCLGQIWTLHGVAKDFLSVATDEEKPPTNLIRCVHKKYVEPVTTSNSDPIFEDIQNAGLPLRIWQVPGSGKTSLPPGTFISFVCASTSECEPPTSQFYAL